MFPSPILSFFTRVLEAVTPDAVTNEEAVKDAKDDGEKAVVTGGCFAIPGGAIAPVW